jgi:hypothetical protein
MEAGGRLGGCPDTDQGPAVQPPRELPPTFAATRDALHQVAFFAMAPRRYAVTGRLGLQWTPGGFGTPPYATADGDEHVRVEGDRLVVQTGDDVHSQGITTVRDAARFVGVDYREQWFDDFHDPLDPADSDQPLAVDKAAGDALGAWFGFATAVLEALRETDGAQDVSTVQLWPEHFDPAMEMGDVDAGQRASYGASPGDADHPEPYLYVAAWGEIDRSDPFWNDHAFNGASIGHAKLAAADDPFAMALDFLRSGHDRPTAG